MLNKMLKYQVKRYNDMHDCKDKGIVTILFEDDISWYVEATNINRTDNSNNLIRWSLKKTSFSLYEVKNTYVVFVRENILKAYDVEATSLECAMAKIGNHISPGGVNLATFIKRNATLDKLICRHVKLADQ